MGVESVIKPARHRADGTRSGFWRSRMNGDYLERKDYGSRWAVESFFSGLKRHDGFDTDLAQARSTAGRSRLQGLGLHPPPLGEAEWAEMFSTEHFCFRKSRAVHVARGFNFKPAPI